MGFITYTSGANILESLLGPGVDFSLHANALLLLAFEAQKFMFSMLLDPLNY